jgi:hypothetical protein
MEGKRKKKIQKKMSSLALSKRRPTAGGQVLVAGCGLTPGQGQIAPSFLKKKFL